MIGSRSRKGGFLRSFQWGSKSSTLEADQRCEFGWRRPPSDDRAGCQDSN